VGIDYPEEYGGLAMGMFEKVLVTEELCKKDSGIGAAISLADIGSGIILHHGSEAQKQRFVAPVTQAHAITAVAAMDVFEKGARSPARRRRMRRATGSAARRPLFERCDCADPCCLW